MRKSFCSVDDCNSKSDSKGMCGKHYKRWRRHGHTDIVQRQGLTLAERLSQHLKRMPNGCLEWQRHCSDQGYGQIVVDRGGVRYRTEGAHRVAWELANGVIPEGLFVCHRCDNPPCCDPEHLFLGTARDNTQDGVDKGRIFPPKVSKARRARGSRSGTAKLVEVNIVDIRTRYSEGNVSQQALADEYGVHQTVISRIIHRKTWAHVTVTA